MSELCICTQGAKASLSQNTIQIKKEGTLLQKVSIEPLEKIALYGNVQITTPLIRECLKRDINISYFSLSGHFYGYITPPIKKKENLERLRTQILISSSEKNRISFSKKIIAAKIHNQKVLLQRYARRRNIDVAPEIKQLNINENILDSAFSISQIMGMEGRAAKSYFIGLSKVITPEFTFSGRNKRPPKDPFNAMLSMGYSALLSEIHGKIETSGLHTGFGFLHSTKNRRPSLACDLIEEWRPVIIDSLVLNMVNHHEIHANEFMIQKETGAVYFTQSSYRKFFHKLNEKLNQEMEYLPSCNRKFTFREALNIQVKTLIDMIDTHNLQLYHPIRIR